MKDDYETKRLWADKIAFLGLFIAVLLIARFIVFFRSSAHLSEPIELDYGCLSISIPVGSGWQGTEQWKYQGNAFTLGSFLSVSPERVSALVSCSYQLAPVKATSQVLFEEKAFSTGGTIAGSGRIKVRHPSHPEEGFVIEWVHINNREVPFNTFFGIIQLPGNRRLDIEVYEGTGDTYSAEELFKSVAGSLELTDDRLLESGSKIIEEIKHDGIKSFLSSGPSSNEGREAFFLIKEAKGGYIGFAMEILDGRFSASSESPPETQLNILAGSFYYIRQGRYGHRQAALFQSDNSFKEFLWKSETYGSSGSSGVEMVLGKDNILSVRKFEGRLDEKRFQIGSAAIPDILGELVFSQMIESGRKEIFVDIIGVGGEITPTHISRMEQDDMTATSGGSDGTAFVKEAAFVFQVDLLDGRNFFERVYLDKDHQVSGRILQQEREYILERTSTENILHHFPEQGKYILQRKDEVFQQNQLMEKNE